MTLATVALNHSFADRINLKLVIDTLINHSIPEHSGQPGCHRFTYLKASIHHDVALHAIIPELLESQ